MPYGRGYSRGESNTRTISCDIQLELVYPIYCNIYCLLGALYRKERSEKQVRSKELVGITNCNEKNEKGKKMYVDQINEF